MSAECDARQRVKTFSVVIRGQQHEFDSFQSALGALAACGVLRNDAEADQDVDFYEEANHEMGSEQPPLAAIQAAGEAALG